VREAHGVNKSRFLDRPPQALREIDSGIGRKVGTGFRFLASSEISLRKCREHHDAFVSRPLRKSGDTPHAAAVVAREFTRPFRRSWDRTPSGFAGEGIDGGDLRQRLL